MHEELTWHVGKDQTPLDKPPYRAYFFWKRGGQIVRSADYSVQELEAEIGKLKRSGEDTAPIAQALERLRNVT
jgi:hypothetical protein